MVPRDQGLGRPHAHLRGPAEAYAFIHRQGLSWMRRSEASPIRALVTLNLSCANNLFSELPRALPSFSSSFTLHSLPCPKPSPVLSAQELQTHPAGAPGFAFSSGSPVTPPFPARNAAQAPPQQHRRDPGPAASQPASSSRCLGSACSLLSGGRGAGGEGDSARVTRTEGDGTTGGRNQVRDGGRTGTVPTDPVHTGQKEGPDGAGTHTHTHAPNHFL